MANDHLYARSADVSNGPWYETSFTTPQLFGVSLELTKPDIDLITGFHKSVTTAGTRRPTPSLASTSCSRRCSAPSKSLSKLGSVRWTITVGSQGEATASTLVVRSTPRDDHQSPRRCSRSTSPRRSAFPRRRTSRRCRWRALEQTAQESRLRVAAHPARPDVARSDLDQLVGHGDHHLEPRWPASLAV